MAWTRRKAAYFPGCPALGQKSRAAYDKAIELAGNTAETAYLTRRRDQLG
jgi:predicted RNA polymerase sigma factor